MAKIDRRVSMGTGVLADGFVELSSIGDSL